ncbi:hypothetical protein [Opitutus terrae]|uniref:Organic solvent tolerance-like N-terminal domain-containing protein n=1 Tax=Opitutus terrae (strain DSM 11246 / JCM 15787 / PB90-1) TaxID=452637 RepID=B1ZNZ0_OPITP|nr:hypothetical protein [Opitutus terrae]ACB77479.1 hypothetical protein Oter_4206 [Opitutus terrae PB90-1]
MKRFAINRADPGSRGRRPRSGLTEAGYIRKLVGIIALGVFALLALPAFAQINAPAKNWALPLFTPEGYRSVTARGSEARALSERQFEVADLNLTFFSGDATTRVDAVILSPLAAFQPDEQIAHGEKRVRYIRDDVEAAGIRWTYWHADKKISLDGDVRVVFRAEIKDLLR